MSKKNRFYVTGGGSLYVVAERTGRYDFDEPVGSFPKRKHAKIFSDEMNRLWREEQEHGKQKLEPR